jgi:hypothetical protein
MFSIITVFVSEGKTQNDDIVNLVTSVTKMSVEADRTVGEHLVSFFDSTRNPAYHCGISL